MPVSMSVRRRRSNHRRGAMLLLVLATLFVLLAAAAFSVDVAYMQLTRTQLRIATDAAARASAETLTRTNDETLARVVAKRIAGQHYVAGKQLALRDEEIVFGQVTKGASGKWDFFANQKPYNSVRIRGDRTKNSKTGGVPLVFGPLLGTSQFEPVLTAAVAKVGSPKRDFCLVVDRSHSMAFDLSSKDWNYPADAMYELNPKTKTPLFSQWRVPAQSSNGYGGKGDARLIKGNKSLGTDFLYYQSGIHPTLCRWAALADAGAVFLDALNDTEDPERVGLASYSSDSTVDRWLGDNYNTIRTSLDDRRGKPMPGSTNIAAGIRDGIRALTRTGATRDGAKKIIVLMTDGVWNQGGSPIPAAREAAANDIIIITITFSAGANQQDMRAVASIAGGAHYHAPTADELRRIFRQIAEGVEDLVFVE